MIFSRIASHLAAAFLLLASIPAFAQLKDLPDFSATEVKTSMTWKIHHSGAMLRVEPSPATATIYVPDEDKVYNLFIFPEKTSCVVMKTAQAQMMRSPLQMVYGPNSKRTPEAAKEVVEGHTCTVLDGVTTMAGGNKVKSKIWAADDLKGVPVRIEVYAGLGAITTTYRDITVGAPDPALFKLPAKCTPQEKTYQLAPKSRQLPKPDDSKSKQ